MNKLFKKLFPSKEMLTNPNENDKLVMRGMFNFKIKTVEDEDCWWNDPVLMRD